MEDSPVLGYMRTEKNDGSEPLLDLFAQTLLAQGWKVGGLVQHTSTAPNGTALMELVDIRTGNRFTISQPLGPDSSGCCLDSGGLCEASAVLRREIDAKVDLLIVNKFAVAEAEGHGLLQELFLAVEQGLPVLTSVASRYQADWDRLLGECGQPLPAGLDQLDQWWREMSAARHAHGSGD